MKIETFKMTEAELIQALGKAERDYRFVTQTYSDFHGLLESHRLLVEMQLYRTELEKRTLSACV